LHILLHLSLLVFFISLTMCRCMRVCVCDIRASAGSAGVKEEQKLGAAPSCWAKRHPPKPFPSHPRFFSMGVCRFC
uniref:Secreted protein n=1 Tax=Stegastes partitus TaxID=144197 RepID=A0A3B4Z0J8_9TELE